MPIYEYACARCGKIFEDLVVQKSDADAVRCPQCGSQKVERQMSRPAASRTGGSGGGARGGSGCGPTG